MRNEPRVRRHQRPGRPRTGGVVIRTLKNDDASYAIRVRVGQDRHLVTLGRRSEGWSEERAEDLLVEVLDYIEQPPPRLFWFYRLRVKNPTVADAVKVLRSKTRDRTGAPKQEQPT